MGRKRMRDEDIDLSSWFRSYLLPDAAGDASSDPSAPALPQAPATQAAAVAPPRNEFQRRFDELLAAQGDDDGAVLGVTRAPPAEAAAVALGPDVDVPSPSKEGLGPDVLPAASKGTDFSPMDEDEQGGQVSRENCSKLSPKFSGEMKNNGKLPLNKRKSQGHGGKRKPPVNKRRAHAVDSEESDYECTLATLFSKRRNQNSSSVRKVQDVVLLDDEDMEPKEKVNHEMTDRLNGPKIYYPSRDDQEAVELTRSDIKCLDPGVFLSSPVINFYIKYIKMTRLCNEDFRDKFYIFNTYFFGKIEEALYETHDLPKLRRWWKGVNIFNNAYIILPIHKKDHWSLVIICLPPKERISEPIILHLDSLGIHRSTKILNIVGRYLEKEWRFLSVAKPVAKPAWKRLFSDIHKKTVKVPQQNNAYDCGIFMLYYIEQFIKEAPATFTADKLNMFNRSWFKPEEASSLRQRIRELLLEEFECATRMDNVISKVDASMGYDSIKRDEELEVADDSSKMVIEVGAGLKNTVVSNGGINVASSEEASGESRNVINNIDEGMKVAEPEEASEVSRDAAKSVEGISVAGLGNTVESNRGMKVAASKEASGESRNVVNNIDEGTKVAEPEEASEAIPNAVSDSSVKRSEGKNEEAAVGTMVPVPGTVFCEESGTAMWITRVYRPDHSCPCRPRYSRDDDTKAFIEQFCGKSKKKKE